MVVDVRASEDIVVGTDLCTERQKPGSLYMNVAMI